MNIVVHILEAAAIVLALGVLVALAVLPFVMNDPEPAPAPPSTDDEWWVGYLEHFPAGAFA
jgi:hypothetical protein